MCELLGILKQKLVIIIEFQLSLIDFQFLKMLSSFLSVASHLKNKVQSCTCIYI